MASSLLTWCRSSRRGAERRACRRSPARGEERRPTADRENRGSARALSIELQRAPPRSPQVNRRTGVRDREVRPRSSRRDARPIFHRAAQLSRPQPIFHRERVRARWDRRWARCASCECRTNTLTTLDKCMCVPLRSSPLTGSGCRVHEPVQL